MIGEIAISGVFVPTLLVIGIAALMLCGVLSTLLSALGFYRLVAMRPVVDLALFAILFAALFLFSSHFGPSS